MPIRKHRLSRLEEQRHRDRLQQLQAEGHDFEIPKEWSENADALTIEVGKPWENELLDLGSIGRVGYYAVRSRMIARRSGVTVLDYEITTDRDDQIELLDLDVRDHLRIFRWCDFKPEEVLNSHLETPLRFHDRGQVIEGWLVAAGSRPIPPEYRHGAIVPFQLTFWDQFGHEFRAEAELSVWRAAKRANAAVRPGSGLYESAENQELSVREDSARRYLRSISRGRVASPDGEGVAPK